MRNLHNILLQEDGKEVRCLLRLWEKLRIRASEYKNHRIFTLRCLHNDLIPVSIKLKSTLKSTRANKILRKAEKDLLQARIKSINFTLDNTSKQLEECRSQLAAIISTQRLRECQDFVDKVGEIRFNKVKQRQLNKFNLLTIRKEGNITRSNTNLNNYNLNSQVNSQVNQFSQAREGSAPPQASPQGRQQVSPGRSSHFSAPSQANSQAREGGAPPQAGATSPGEDNRSPLAGPPHREARTSPPPSQANSQAREGGAPPQAGATSPGEDNSLSQAITSPPCRPVLSCPHQKAADLPTLPVPNQVKLAILTTLLGKAVGAPPGIGPPRPPRRSTPPPGKAIIPPPPC